MARGGPRPNSGPIKGTKYVQCAGDADVKKAAKSAGLTPLEYMLQVMNDEAADLSRRDRMAMAAAPYVHGRASDIQPGKKEERQAKAEELASAGMFAPRSGPKLAVNNR